MHQHPELSFEETETAKYIAQKLESFGLEVKKNIGGNGLVGILTGTQPGKTIYSYSNRRKKSHHAAQSS